MNWVVKYALDMEKLGLKTELKGGDKDPWKIICISDSNYTDDPGTNHSMSGFSLDVSGVLVSL